MRLWKRARRYSGKGDTLLKYIYLTDAEVIYRHATTTPLLGERLDDYYAQLSVLYEERRRALTFYTIVFAASVLAAFDGIKEASAGGITVSSEVLKHVLLLVWPLTQCRLGILDAKYNFISSIFKQKLWRLKPFEKVDFLARYPLAITYDEYYLDRVGQLPFLIRMGFQVRFLAFILLVFIGLLAYIASGVWIFAVLATSVIRGSGSFPEFWSWCVVTASAAAMLFSYLLPAVNIFKKRYTHMGLVTVMNALINRDRERYSHFVRIIFQIEERK